jgi:outer membrane lipoprotein LolB
MAAKTAKKAWSASVNWQQQGMNSYQIRLYGPLGSGTVLVEKQGGVVTYKDGPKTVSSASAEELLQQQTGIRLPVNQLYYWVRGLAAPGPVHSKSHDSAHRLSTLNQSGYAIQYLNYTSIENIALPQKIQLQGHGIFIKFVIKSWRF